MESDAMEALCRLCVEGAGDVVSIEGGVGDRINSCLPVKVDSSDDLPHNICKPCLLKVDTFYEFANTCKESERRLIRMIRGETATATSSITKPTYVKQEEVDVAAAIGKTEVAEAEEESKSYLFQQRFVEEEESASLQAPSRSEDDDDDDDDEEELPPPPKRAKRTAALKAAIALDQNSDDDLDDDMGDAHTKTEDQTDDSDDNFLVMPSTSGACAENSDQPGPSTVAPSAAAAKSSGSASAAADPVEAPTITNIQCGLCLSLFPSKDDFKLHSSGRSCCLCKITFENIGALYRHYATHTEQCDDEEMVLSYRDEEEEEERDGGNEYFYIVDDSACVNEIVIDEKKDVATLVNTEHGYVIPTKLIVEDVGNLTVCESTRSIEHKKRNPQPKKRHEVPDFSAADYVFLDPNDSIEVAHYKCLRCEQIFINKFGFHRHIEKGKCYTNNCDVCLATFTRNTEFYAHYVDSHKDRAICNFCFRTFMYEKNVKEHMLRHLDQFRHRCDECNKGFYTVREYRNHYKNRHMGIRHKCEVCARSFADEYYFRRHVEAHARATAPKVDQ